MRIYGFYNREGVYPNLLTPIYENCGDMYTQIIRGEEVLYYQSIDIRGLDQDHLYHNTSTNLADPNKPLYAFMTSSRMFYLGDRKTMQKTVQDNLPFVPLDSPVYESLQTFANTQDIAQ